MIVNSPLVAASAFEEMRETLTKWEANGPLPDWVDRVRGQIELLEESLLEGGLPCAKKLLRQWRTEILSSNRLEDLALDEDVAFDVARVR